jgi:hypothetical protein
MRLWSNVALLLVLGLSGPGRCQDLPAVLDPSTEDGRILLEIGEQDNEARIVLLLERFMAKFPKHEAMPWVLVQLQSVYLKRSELDKVLDVGEKTLLLAPDSLDAVHNGLRAAQAKKDPGLIRAWAVKTWDVSHLVETRSRPDTADQVEAWQSRLKYARSLTSYSEYTLYCAALNVAEPKRRIEYLQDLEQRNPQSSYLTHLHSQYYTAFRQLGDLEQSVTLAETSFREGKADEDMLTLLTVYHHRRKDIPKTLVYAAKVVEMVTRKAKPENLTIEEWDRKKSLALGNAHYLTGVIYSEQDRFQEADRYLRAALPYLKFDQHIRASALFHLGWANYQMGEQAQSPGLINEALRFNAACAAIDSPFRQQAQKNFEAIKIEYDLK